MASKARLLGSTPLLCPFVALRSCCTNADAVSERDLRWELKAAPERASPNLSYPSGLLVKIAVNATVLDNVRPEYHQVAGEWHVTVDCPTVGCDGKDGTRTTEFANHLNSVISSAGLGLQPRAFDRLLFSHELR
jgi:hypothetical protein